MDNFFQNMDEPKDLDLRTSFVSPITGISILINNFSLFMLVLLCSLSTCFSLFLTVFALVTIPVFISMINLMVINKVLGTGLTVLELMPYVYKNFKVKLLFFCGMIIIPLCLSIIIYLLSGTISRTAMIYTGFGFVCFSLVWGLLITNGLLLCNNDKYRLSDICVKSIDLIYKKPTLLFGQIIVWIMEIMFCMSILFSYVIILPYLGMEVGSLSYTVTTYIIVFFVASLFISFYISGISVLLLNWYRNDINRQ